MKNTFSAIGGLRDQLATAAMQGLLAADSEFAKTDSVIARLAYEQADEMLKARGHGTGGHVLAPIKPKQAAMTLLNETIIALEGEEPSAHGTELLCALLEARDMLTKKLWVGKNGAFAPDAAYEAWLEQRTLEQNERGLR